MAGPHDIAWHGSSGSRPDLSGPALSPFESVNSVDCRPVLGEEDWIDLINNHKDLDELFVNGTSMVVNEGKPEDNDQKPQLGMKFATLEEAEEFYRNHARRSGFTVRKGKVHKLPDGALKWRRFLCSCQGLRAKKQSNEGTKYQKLETRTGCLAHIQFTLENEGYKITHLQLEHNHCMSNSNSNGSPDKNIKEAPTGPAGKLDDASVGDKVYLKSPLKRSRLEARPPGWKCGKAYFAPGEEAEKRLEEDLTIAPRLYRLHKGNHGEQLLDEPTKLESMGAVRLFKRLLMGNHKKQLLEEVTKLDSIRQQLHMDQHQGSQLPQQTQEDSASSYSEESITKASTDVQNASCQLTMEEQLLLISNAPDATQVPPTNDTSQWLQGGTVSGTPAASENWRGLNTVVQAQVSTSSISRGSESIWQQILTKYGDITAKLSLTSPTFVSFVKQSILEVVELLQNNTARGLSSEDLSTIGRMLGDLELLQVDVGWLRTRYVAVEHTVAYAKAKDDRDGILRRLQAKSAEVAELQLDLDLAEAHLQGLQHRLPPWLTVEEKLGKGLL